MVLILAAMMAFGSIAGTMDTAPIDGGTDGIKVIYKGNVVLAIGQDPEDVFVQVYNNTETRIAKGYCDANYHFEVITDDGTTFVTDDVTIVLTDEGSANLDTVTHTVEEWKEDYFWFPSPDYMWLHGSGIFNFTI